MTFIFTLFILSIVAMIVWGDASLFKGMLWFFAIIAWLAISLFAFGASPILGLLVLLGGPLSLIFIAELWDDLDKDPVLAKERHIKFNDVLVKKGKDPIEWNDLTIEEYNNIVKQREEFKKNSFFRKLLKRNKPGK